MKKAIICDIDGCLLYTSHIFDEVKAQGLEGSQKWEYFNKNANRDCVKFNYALSEILFNFYNQGFAIILLTARVESIRNQTRSKITYENILAGCNYKYSLYMRDENDNGTPSHESKLKHLKELKEKYFIILAIDDEDENCKMFQENGILTMKAINREAVPA